MKPDNGHPADLGAYIDGELPENEARDLSAHLSGCSRCRSEVEKLQQVDRIFRRTELQIEVPAFQWQRIRATLEAEPNTGRSPWRISNFRLLPGFLWRLAAVAVAVAGITVGTLEYRRYSNERQLAAIQQYARAEKAGPDTAANPFRAPSTPGDLNPFSAALGSNDANPFSQRQ